MEHVNRKKKKILMYSQLKIIHYKSKFKDYAKINENEVVPFIIGIHAKRRLYNTVRRIV